MTHVFLQEVGTYCYIITTLSSLYERECLCFRVINLFTFIITKLTTVGETGVRWPKNHIIGRAQLAGAFAFEYE